MSNDDAAAQFRAYVGIEKGHTDVENKVVELEDEICPVECEATNHEGYTHEEFEAEVAAPDADPEVED